MKKIFLLSTILLAGLILGVFTPFSAFALTNTDNNQLIDIYKSTIKTTDWYQDLSLVATQFQRDDIGAIKVKMDIDATTTYVEVNLMEHLNCGDPYDGNFRIIFQKQLTRASGAFTTGVNTLTFSNIMTGATYSDKCYFLRIQGNYSGFYLYGSNVNTAYPYGNLYRENWNYTDTIVKDAYMEFIPAYVSPTIASLHQFKSDATNTISEGSVTTEGTVIFGAMLQSSSTNQLRLEVEYTTGATFTGVANATSTPVAPGSIAIVTASGLKDGNYRWRARAVDTVTSAASDWQEFGIAGNVDFIVNLPLSYKAANLAKELIYQPYLLGGKGWDYNQSLFATVSAIKTGYHYYNSDIKSVDTGIGVDCSGLIMWAYNRSFDPTKSRFNNFVKAEGADEQYRYNTTSTAESELRPGDVMFFDWDSNGFMDHVAMYVGESDGFDIVQARSRQLGIVSASKDNLKQQIGFIGFKQVVSALLPAVLAVSHSPVDLVLTDPDGFTITPTTVVPSDEEFLREIPGVLYYSEMEKGMDGNPIDQIYSYIAKTGDYTIKVLPESGAPFTATYTLDFSVNDQLVVLADNVPISQIPTNGYGITTSETGTTSSFVPVAIDIKPGNYPNSINLKSNGVVPVAIFGSATFDVKQVDSATVKLANAPAKLKGNGQPMASFEDVNGDGFTDIVVHVVAKALQLTVNNVKANLEGRLFNGTIIKGSDSVRIVP
ncbi:MAG: NlpC/P60 family protein [Patescibacteria group bacterium]